MIKLPMDFEYLGDGKFKVTSTSENNKVHQISLKEHSCSCSSWLFKQKKVKQGKLKGKITCKHLQELKIMLKDNPSIIKDFQKENFNYPNCFKRTDWDHVQE